MHLLKNCISQKVFYLDKIKSNNLIHLKNTFVFLETSHKTLTFSLMKVKVALKIFQQFIAQINPFKNQNELSIKWERGRSKSRVGSDYESELKSHIEEQDEGI